MATKPDLLKWVANDDALKIIDPGESKKANGFLYLEKPTFQYINYLFNRLSKWLRGLQGSYFDVIVGSTSQVTAYVATHTINQLTDGIVAAGSRVLFLEGTHTLTANLTLTNANVCFEMENAGSIIDLASTYKLSFTGARCQAKLKFANVTAAADAVTISGVSSSATLFDIAVTAVVIAATAVIQCIGTTSALSVNSSVYGVEKGSDVASAATLQIGKAGRFFHVTGTTGVTGISARPAGETVTFLFESALTITNNGTSMMLAGGIDLVVEPNSTVTFISEGSSNWRSGGNTAGIKANNKDHGSKSAAYTLYMDEADMHVISFTAAATLTIASRRTNDRALVVVKNGGNIITLAGIDNDPPTLTNAATRQDFIALTKSFGKITAVSAALNRLTS